MPSDPGDASWIVPFAAMVTRKKITQRVLEAGKAKVKVTFFVSSSSTTKILTFSIALHVYRALFHIYIFYISRQFLISQVSEKDFVGSPFKYNRREKLLLYWPLLVW